MAVSSLDIDISRLCLYFSVRCVVTCYWQWCYYFKNCKKTLFSVGVTIHSHMQPRTLNTDVLHTSRVTPYTERRRTPVSRLSCWLLLSALILASFSCPVHKSSLQNAILGRNRSILNEMEFWDFIPWRGGYLHSAIYKNLTTLSVSRILRSFKLASTLKAQYSVNISRMKGNLCWIYGEKAESAGSEWSTSLRATLLSVSLSFFFLLYLISSLLYLFLSLFLIFLCFGPG